MTIEIEERTVPRVKKYLDEGGFLVWHSLDLSNPSIRWITPLNTGKPTWKASNVSTEVTNPDDVIVVTHKLFKQLRAHLRWSSSGLHMTLTGACLDRVNRWVEKCQDKYGETVVVNDFHDGHDTINICYIDKKETLNEYLKNKATQVPNPTGTVADR